MKLNACVDFDGVLNNYKGWDGDNLYTPRKGAKEFLEKLNEKYNVYILTSRDIKLVKRWLFVYGLETLVHEVTNIKVPAKIYLDDNGIRFDGDFNKALNDIENLHPHWEELNEENCNRNKKRLD